MKSEFPVLSDSKKEILQLRQEVLDLYLEHYPNYDTSRIVKAMDYAEMLHRGQLRRSKKPYIIHPLRVAKLAASFQLDESCIIIALLHDTIEDTVATKETVAKKFDEHIAELVEALTKIRTFSKDKTVVDKQSTYQRILQASAKDIRALLIKILDRLNNMREMEFMPRESQLRISRETIDIYVPLTRRLGVNLVERELSNLSLQYLYPAEVRRINERIEKAKEDFITELSQTSDSIRQHCKDNDIRVDVRYTWPEPCDFYSISRATGEGILAPNSDIVVDFKLFIESIIELYSGLGVIHSLFRPMPKELKDMVANPIANGYRALETTLLINNRIHTFSLLTREMDEMNKRGIIHNWKVNQNRLSSYFTSYMRLLGEILIDEDIRVNEVLNQSNVEGIYVYSPKKDPYFLPFDSTVLDFAYAIHNDVGHHAKAALVNGLERPIHHKLTTGDIVEIIKDDVVTPQKNWEGLVETPKAKSSIRSWLNKEVERRSLEMGKQMLFFEVEKYGKDPEILVNSHDFKKLLEKEAMTLDALYKRIWHRNIIVPKFLAKHGIVSRERIERQQRAENAWIKNKIFSNLKTQRGPACKLSKNDIFMAFAQCCKPIIGDSVVGLHNLDKGIIVHRESCPNIKKVPYDRRIRVEWDMDRALEDTVLHLQVKDTPGVLAKIMTAINRQNVNIIEFDASTIQGDSGKEALLKFRLDLTRQKELLKVVNEIRKISAVVAITHE